MVARNELPWEREPGFAPTLKELYQSGGFEDLKIRASINDCQTDRYVNNTKNRPLSALSHLRSSGPLLRIQTLCRC
jgi:hypothetical protein